MKKINVGNYTVTLYKRQTIQPKDPGPTRVEVIAGERPPHWIIRLIRGGMKWDLIDMKSVIPPTNKAALDWAESKCVYLTREGSEHIENAIYYLAGMRPNS